jgi:death on curing protein
MRRYLTVKEVVAFHDRILTEIGGLPGFRDQGLVDSAVNRLHTGYYKNLFEEAAALMESLANNHGFLDGNKRTAFVSTDAFLRLNGFHMRVEPLAAHALMTQAIAQHIFKFDLILAWIFTDYERIEEGA